MRHSQLLCVADHKALVRAERCIRVSSAGCKRWAHEHDDEHGERRRCPLPAHSRPSIRLWRGTKARRHDGKTIAR